MWVNGFFLFDFFLISSICFVYTKISPDVFILYFVFCIFFLWLSLRFSCRQSNKHQKKRKREKEKKKKKKRKEKICSPSKKRRRKPGKKEWRILFFSIIFFSGFFFFCGNDIYNPKDVTDYKHILIRKYVERVMRTVNCVANSKQQCHHNTVLLSRGHLTIFFSVFDDVIQLDNVLYSGVNQSKNVGSFCPTVFWDNR